MANLLDLSKRMKKLAASIPRETNRAKVEVASAMLQYLTFNGTPVDTSKALSNWQIGFNGPAVGILEALIPGIGGWTAQASARVAYDIGMQSLRATYLKTGISVHLTNNAEYIVALNEGHSKQNRDFVAQALAIGQTKLRNFKMKLDYA